MDLHQLDRRLSLGCDLGVHLGMACLHQRALAHAARAPQECIVGGQAAREAQRVVEKLIARAVDALQQANLHAADPRHRFEPLGISMPDEGVGGIEVRTGGARGSHALQGLRDAGKDGAEIVHRMCHERTPWRRAIAVRNGEFKPNRNARYAPSRT